MKFPEKYRQEGWVGHSGSFLVPYENRNLLVIASNDLLWDHVSVSLINRCPNWPEMCAIKNLFWDEEECVMQLHPAKSKYINNHPYVLHLWKPQQEKIPLPPLFMV